MTLSEPVKRRLREAGYLREVEPLPSNYKLNLERVAEATGTSVARPLASQAELEKRQAEIQAKAPRKPAKRPHVARMKLRPSMKAFRVVLSPDPFFNDWIMFQDEKRALREVDQVCRYCMARPAVTVDHVLPQSKEGRDIRQNLVGCCRPCNHRKGSKTPREVGMTLHLPLRFFYY